MLKVLSIEQSNEWDTIVRGFKNYDTYWLSGYVKAFQIHGDGEPLLFYYEDATVRGINVVMKRDIAKEKHLETLIEENKWFDFVTPYGYGGWIIEGDNADDLFSVYEKWCRSNGIVSEFVRFHPLIFNHVFSKRLFRNTDLSIYTGACQEKIIERYGFMTNITFMKLLIFLMKY